MWYMRGIARGGCRGVVMGRAFEGVSRQGEGGWRPSRARSNGNEPYLSAYYMSAASAVASAAVEVENCDSRGMARGRARGGQQRVARRNVGGRVCSRAR